MPPAEPLGGGSACAGGGRGSLPAPTASGVRSAARRGLRFTHLHSFLLRLVVSLVASVLFLTG